MNKRKITILIAVIFVSSLFIIPSISKVVIAESEDPYRVVGMPIYGGYSSLAVDILTGLTTIKTDASGNQYVDLEGGTVLALSLGFVTALYEDQRDDRSIYQIRILVHVYDYTYRTTLSTSNIMSGSAPIFEQDSNAQGGTTCYNIVMDAASIVADVVAPGSGIIFDVLSYFCTEGGMTISTDGSSKVAKWKAGTFDWDIYSQECKWDGFIRGLSSSNSRIYKIGVDVQITQYYNFRYWTQTISNDIYVNGIPTTDDGGGSGGGTKPIYSID